MQCIVFSDVEGIEMQGVVFSAVEGIVYAKSCFQCCCRYS